MLYYKGISCGDPVHTLYARYHIPAIIGIQRYSNYYISYFITSFYNCLVESYVLVRIERVAAYLLHCHPQLVAQGTASGIRQ